MLPPRTLLVSGSLSARSVREGLRLAAGNVHVLEFDTAHDHSLYPGVAAWQDYTSLIPLQQANSIDADAHDVIDLFLSFDVSDAGVPTHRSFRSASLSSRAWRVAVPYLINVYLGQQMLKSAAFDIIKVAAGAGINLSAWRELAERESIPLEILPYETATTDLRRRLWKAWHRWRKPNDARLTAPSSKQGTSALSNGILCTSERIARLLATESTSDTLPIFTLTPQETKATDAEKVAEYKRLYRLWWQRWLQAVTESGGDLVRQPGSFQIVRTIGEHAVENTYAEHACIYEHARQRLQTLQPRLLLCDTQIGTAERMWSLAAQELGIPVVAYIYDQIPNPRFSFCPDYLLSSSTRTTLMSIQRGVPEKSIIEVCSHRQSRLPQIKNPAENKKPLILYADTYYAGTRAADAPNATYGCYRQIVATAKLLPEFEFAIKFHPLREKKQEELSFVALDEHEIRNRKLFIKELNPPKNLRFIEPEVSMITLLEQTFVMLNLNSTAAHEAFHMGVPVVFLQRPVAESMAYMRIHELGACISAEDADSLVEWLQKIRKDADLRETHITNQRRYLEQIYWPSERPITEGIQMCLKLISPNE